MSGVFEPVRARFVLNASELRRAHAGAARAAIVLVCAGSALQIVFWSLHLRRDSAAGYTANAGVDLAFIAVHLVLLVLCVAAFAVALVAKRGDIAIGPAGISGSLDGRAVTVAWRDVESVLDDGELFLFSQRPGFFRPRLRWRIAVPKRELADPARLWSQLDDLLVAKRGLIRRPGSHRLIVNSAR